jgi:hypothetical protein
MNRQFKILFNSEDIYYLHLLTIRATLRSGEIQSSKGWFLFICEHNLSCSCSSRVCILEHNNDMLNKISKYLTIFSRFLPHLFTDHKKKKTPQKSIHFQEVPLMYSVLHTQYITRYVAVTARNNSIVSIDKRWNTDAFRNYDNASISSGIVFRTNYISLNDLTGDK